VILGVVTTGLGDWIRGSWGEETTSGVAEGRAIANGVGTTPGDVATCD
jgi:hypothetical protein